VLKTEKMADTQKRHEYFTRYQKVEQRILTINREIKRRLKRQGLLDR